MLNQIHTHITNLAWREASIASTPELQEKRLRLISENPNFFRRMGARGLHVVAKRISRQTITALSMPYESRGLDYIGSGWNSTVVRQGNLAIKIVRETELMKPEMRDSVLTNLRKLIDVNVACHPDVTMPTEVREMPHPLTERPVIAIVQPYLSGVDALSNPITPDVQDRLSEFAEKSLDEMVPNGVAPDLVGRGNILTYETESGSELRLVDSVALRDTRTHHAAFPYSVKKLRELVRRK